MRSLPRPSLLPRPAAMLVAAGVLLAGCARSGDQQAATPPASGPAPAVSASDPHSAPPPVETSAPPSADRPTEAGQAATVIQVHVAGGRVQGGVQRVDVALGTPVRIEVVADVADELHVHGYERHIPVTPGQPAVVELIADIPGVFEIELEQAGLRLVELRVQ